MTKMDELMKIELTATVIKQIKGAANLNDATQALLNYLDQNTMPVQLMATVISKIRGSLYSEALNAVGKYIATKRNTTLEALVKLNKELHPLCDLTNDQLYEYFDKWMLENESKIPEEVMYAYQHGIKGLLFTANSKKVK